MSNSNNDEDLKLPSNSPIDASNFESANGEQTHVDDLEASNSNDDDGTSADEQDAQHTNCNDDSNKVNALLDAAEKEKLERKRFLNRLTWKRKHIREKMRLMQLERSQTDLTEKNRKLHHENGLMRRLVNKMSNKIEAQQLLRQLETQQQQQQKQQQLQAEANSVNFAMRQQLSAAQAHATAAAAVAASQTARINQETSMQLELSRLQQQQQLQLQQPHNQNALSLDILRSLHQQLPATFPYPGVVTPLLSSNLPRHLNLQVASTDNSFFNQQGTAQMANQILQPNNATGLNNSNISLDFYQGFLNRTSATTSAETLQNSSMAPSSDSSGLQSQLPPGTSILPLLHGNHSGLSGTSMNISCVPNDLSAMLQMKLAEQQQQQIQRQNATTSAILAAISGSVASLSDQSGQTTFPNSSQDLSSFLFQANANNISGMNVASLPSAAQLGVPMDHNNASAAIAPFLGDSSISQAGIYNNRDNSASTHLDDSHPKQEDELDRKMPPKYFGRKS